QERPVQGLPLEPLVRALGGMGEKDRLFALSASDGVAAVLTHEEVRSAVLVFRIGGESFPEAPLLFWDPSRPPAAQVKGLVLNWQGERLPEVGLWPEKAVLTLVTPEGERPFTLAELETHFVAWTYPGSYVRGSGEKVTALWTGIPLGDLLGHWPADTEIEVVAADGYRMRYRYGALQDAEGMWLLAFKQDGKYLPFNPGYFRLVKAGPRNPSFPSAASARMVVRIEVRGKYRPYSLKLSGVRTHEFSRWDLELGVACPCRARAVTSTHKGETRVYVGIPLWRLLAYVDDEVVPAGLGLKYEDAAFNWELARGEYLVEIRAADGFSQVIPSAYLAGEDRFLLALKVDGRFLGEAEGGPLLFVWDDGVPVPARLKRVKWVTEILIRPKE
ncbi:MAG: molybdopterin-dependent oxidoreductase, partial [Candidatus Bipolaricaulota bacterium]|nr:molybdopterin-dependent oxidoreductase [Candidatus Bipolaricaulota bacterium]MDW8127318.1 hypothetical protein [Candidatus Bipolaricaulota bacterium]